MRSLLQRYCNRELSRRDFVETLVGLGFTAAAAQAALAPLEASETSSGKHAHGTTHVRGTGGELVVAQMKAAGTEYLFTNPGSFEVGFFDAFLADGSMQLILGLHEGVVISMADGYHRASGKPAFVNLHVIAGTAQAAGQMYNASRDGSALVVTAGLNDNEMWSDEAQLAPRPGYDQKEVNRQFTKISWEAREPRSLALMLRRAYKVAAAAPGGPVYLAFAHHALEARDVDAAIMPAGRFLHSPRMRPAKDDLERAARHLIEAKNPVLIAGDEVWKSGAQQELLELSEKLGLAVAYSNQSYQNFPSHHPHYVGRFRPSGEYAKGADALMMIGAADFGGRLVPKSPEAPLDARFIRLSANADDMGRNYPVDLPLFADVRDGLRDLLDAVDSLTTADRRRKLAEPRSRALRAAFDKAEGARVAAARRNMGASPMHPDELGEALAKEIDPNAIVVEESITGRHGAIRRGFRDDEAMYMYASGRGLGWGVGAASGAKLAQPDRQVVCSIGDGSVMYSAPGFWTQARYEIPVLTVVWNNRNYQTVRMAYHRYKGKMTETDRYPGMYLGDPDIDFVGLAKSQGVAGEAVREGAELAKALRRGVAAVKEGQPYLLDVSVARYGGGAESEWRQEFSLAEQRRRRA